MKSVSWILGSIAALAIGFSSYAENPVQPEAGVESDVSVSGHIAVDEAGRTGRIHVVVAGDTLWDISSSYLHTPWVWPSIWKANPRIENPHRIKPGDKIWISEEEMRRVTDEEAARMIEAVPAEPEAAAEEVAVSEPEPVPEVEMAVEETPAAPASEPEEEMETPKALVTLDFQSRDQRGVLGVDTFDKAPVIEGSSYPAMLLGQGQEVYIDRGAGDGIQVGDRFNIVRVQGEVRDPESRKLIGNYVERLGWLEVISVRTENSTAVIQEARREISRGERLVPRTEEPTEIVLTTGSVSIDGKIVYLPDERSVAANKDVVFLDRGAQDGLEVGNLLEVVRYGGVKLGSSMASKKLHFPDEVIAHLVILDAGSKTAMAYVAYSVDPLQVGDVFRAVTN